MVIFRADRQHDAETFKLLYVGLKLVVGLRNAGLLADLDAVYAVVAHNAAPQGVIEVKGKRLFILAENRLDNVRNTERKGRDRLKAHGVFVHVPEQRVRPFFQAVIGRNKVEVVNIKAFIFACVGVKRFV